MNYLITCLSRRLNHLHYKIFKVRLKAQYDSNSKKLDMKQTNGILTFLIFIGCFAAKGQKLTFDVKSPSCFECCDGTLTVTATCPFGAALGGIAPSLNMTGGTHSPKSAVYYDGACCGTYTMTMIQGGHPGECGPNVLVDTITIPCNVTGIFNQYNTINYKYSIYPNPTSKILKIETDSWSGADVLEITITDLLGETKFKQTLLSNKEEINIESLNDGVCFIRLIKDGRLLYNAKFVKHSY